MTLVEEQKQLRAFIKDLLVATIEGNPDKPRNLGTWIEEAIGEKIHEDITKVYPATLLEGTERVREAVRASATPRIGAFYLRKKQTVVLIRLAKRSLIRVLRTDPEHGHEQDAVQEIVTRCQDNGIECTNVAVVYVPKDSNSVNDIWTWVPEGTPKQLQTMADSLVMAVVMRQSERDVQRLPGPSDLANPCDLCVARKLAQSLGIRVDQPAPNFSLKAWVGTSMHQKIERDMPAVYALAEHEITVEIAQLLGLGQVKGHVDLYVPPEAALTDFKSTDLKKLDFYKSFRVPVAHMGQTMLYCYGLRKAEKEVRYATLAYIPRDSTDVSDIWVASCPYREDVAYGLLNRTQKLVEVVRSGDTSTLESYDDCFVCNRQQRYAR